MAREQKRRQNGLTSLQQRFCRLYIKTNNATEAYRIASGSKMNRKSLSGNAQRLLRETSVRLELDKLRAGVEKRTEVATDRVVRELARIAFTNFLDFMVITSDGNAYCDLSAVTREQAAAIAQVQCEVLLAKPEDIEAAGIADRGGPVVLRTTVKLHDKLPALNTLARHLGMFEKHNAQVAAAALPLRDGFDPIDRARRLAFALDKSLRHRGSTKVERAKR